jgi:hypothetical protein
MNTESIPTTRVESGKMELPGDFCFDEERKHIYLILPGTKHPDSLRIQKGNPGGPRVWGWDGNEEKPTLSPSIHAPGEWHGFLIDGFLKSC